MKSILLIFIILLISFSITTEAHLEGGEDKVIGEFLIDFGYDPVILSAKAPTFFSINLVNKTTKEPINITSTWVRVSNSEEIVFSGEFKSERGNINFNYKFPGGGNYEMKVRFKNQNQEILETDFLLHVERRDQRTTILLTLFIVVLLIVLNLKLKKRR